MLELLSTTSLLVSLSSGELEWTCSQKSLKRSNALGKVGEAV